MLGYGRGNAAWRHPGIVETITLDGAPYTCGVLPKNSIPGVSRSPAQPARGLRPPCDTQLPPSLGRLRPGDAVLVAGRAVDRRRLASALQRQPGFVHGTSLRELWIGDAPVASLLAVACSRHSPFARNAVSVLLSRALAAAATSPSNGRPCASSAAIARVSRREHDVGLSVGLSGCRSGRPDSRRRLPPPTLPTWIRIGVYGVVLAFRAGAGPASGLLAVSPASSPACATSGQSSRRQWRSRGYTASVCGAQWWPPWRLSFCGS